MATRADTLTEATLDELRRCLDGTEGMVSFPEAVLLYCLAAEVTSGCIVEVGSYRGRSSVFLGRGSLAGARAPVYAIDPHERFTGVLGGQFGPPDRTAFYRAMLDHGCSEIVSLVNLSSEVFAAGWTKPVGLLWIDGDHRYEGVRRDFDCWEPHLTSDATIAFDDASDPALGPRRLIGELVTSGRYAEVGMVGKVAVLKPVSTP